MRILTADDSQNDRELLTIVLKKSGHEVIEAVDGEQALELAKSRKPDLIISDALMPKIDGLNLLRKLRQNESTKNIPFILYSATYGDDNYRNLAKESGASSILQKPAAPDVLLKEIASAAEKMREILNPIPETEFHKRHDLIVQSKLEKKVIELEAIKAKLEKSERQYRELFESSLDGIYQTDKDGRFILVNPAMAKLFGHRGPKEMLGKQALQYWASAEDRDRFVHYLNKHKSIASYPITGRRANGELIYLESTSRLLLGERGEYMGIEGILRDVTKRKRAEEERDRMFTHSIDLMFVADMEGYFKQTNPAWRSVLGWAEEELFAKSTMDFIHPDDKEATKEACKRLGEGIAITQFKNRFICKDESYKWISWNIIPIPKEKLVFAVGRDITANMELERQLNDKIEELERFYKMAINRELKMKELKKENDKLNAELSKRRAG